MKRSVVAIITVVGVLMVAAILVLSLKYRQESARYAESRQSEQEVRSQFNAALESIAEIQDSLSAITPEETHLRSSISETGEMGPVTQTQKDQMLGKISNLKESIKNSNRRIRDLEKSLKGSQTEVSGLRRIIDNLKRSVAEKETMIVRLTARVDSLNVTVAGLRTDVLEGQQTIAHQRIALEDRRKEIGTVYYVIGTKDDLKKKGIVKETGGVLGIGKSTQLSGTLNRDDFASIDTDKETEISINGREPRVLSAQTRSSYELVAGQRQAKLRILDAAEFRKVRYLVVMVK